MKLFKKKKKGIGRNSNIYMPKQTSSIIKRKTGKTSINRKLQEKRGQVKRIIGILLVIAIICVLGWLLIRFIIDMRTSTYYNYYTSEDVVGLDNIPAYPNSEFIFKSETDNASVINFIGSGNSAYRLPDDVDIDDVYEFYNEKLPSLEWKYVQTVPTGSDEMKSGMYWTKDGKGLRIYSKFNDVWYETITEEQATTGLRDEVEEEISMDLLLAENDMQDLLPDYPWVASIPKEYVISYGSAGIIDLKYVSMKKLGFTDEIKLTPVGSYAYEPLDNFLYSYISLLAKNGEENCILSTTEIANTENVKALRGVITCTNNKHIVAVVVDTNNNYAYVLDSNNPENEFFDTLLSTLRLNGSTKK